MKFLVKNIIRVCKTFRTVTLLPTVESDGFLVVSHSKSQIVVIVYFCEFIVNETFLEERQNPFYYMSS